MSNGKNDALDSFFKAADAIKKDKVEEYEEILESFESKEEEIVETPIPQEPPVQNTTESYLQQLRGTSGPAFSSFHSKKEIKPEGDMNQYVDRVKHASTGDIYEQDLQNTPATMKDLGNLSQQIAANLQTSLTSLGGGGLGEKDVLQLIADNVPDVDVELDSAQLDKVIQELQGLMLDSSEVVLKAGDTMTGPLIIDNADLKVETLGSKIFGRMLSSPYGTTESLQIAKSGSVHLAISSGVTEVTNFPARYDDNATHSVGDNPYDLIHKEYAEELILSTVDSEYINNLGVVGYTDSDFDARLATKTSDDVIEGNSNRYYTDTRIDNRVKLTVDSAYVNTRVDIGLNELNDVSVDSIQVDQFLSWNGSMWQGDTPVTEGVLNFKGVADIHEPNSAPSTKGHADTWLASSTGIVDSSWEIYDSLGAGAEIDANNLVIYDSNRGGTGSWVLIQPSSGDGVIEVREGYGVNILGTPERPTVEIDSSEVSEFAVNRAGSSMSGDLTLDAADLILTNGGKITVGEIDTDSSELVLKFEGSERVAVGNVTTKISNAVARYDSAAAAMVDNNDLNLIHKEYAETLVTNHLTGYIPLGGATLTGDLDFDSSNFITNLPDPADDQHAATKAYVDGIAGAFDGTFLPLSGGTLLGDLILDSNNGSVSNITVKSGNIRATDGGSMASNVYNSVGNSNVSFQRNGSTGIQIVSESVRIFKEMVYASQPVIDNSDNWTSTTLVHKGYVDNAISGISGGGDGGVDSAATIDMIENTVDSAYIESRIDVVSPSSVGTTVAAARFKYSTSFSYDSAGAMPGSFVVNQFGISDIARTAGGRYTVVFDSDTATLLGGRHNYIVMTTIDYNGDNPTLSSRHIAVNGQTDDMFYLLAERSDNGTDGDYNDQSFINFQVIRMN